MLHAAHVGHWRVVETAGRWRVLQAAFLTTAAAALYGRSLVTYGLPLLILPLVTTLTLTGGISVISEADGIPSFVRRHWHVLIQFVPRKYVNPRADVYGQDCAASFNVRCPAEESSVYVCACVRGGCCRLLCRYALFSVVKRAVRTVVACTHRLRY
jgi:hypothetical protein